jgi:tRNA-splicing ligase RtcB
MAAPQHAVVPLPLIRKGEVVYELADPAAAGARVPVRVFADEVLIGQIGRDRSLSQLVNVTALPGIYGAAMGMPDMHEGYGFPVGGVAATLLPDGVISPGGIGFDINCGVRLLVAPQKRGDLADRIEAIVHDLSRAVPAGMGRGQGGAGALDTGDLDRVLTEGVPYLVKDKGLGEPEDLEFIESGGALPGADAAAVSDRAKLRGGDQLGTLGSGNHFLEVQVVDEIFDARTASAFGLEAEQIVILIHSGSRGLGHQVCTDYVQRMDRAAERYGYTLPDRQLACAPLSSAEGKAYFAAMAAAANFGFGNRQVITQRVRGVWRRAFGAAGQLRLLYDVAHNTAKIERHGNRTLCVHRKGATRAFGPSASELPAPYRGVGQPVLIPGSMGTASFVLVGTDQAAELTWSSSCHGAGRAMSRGAARRAITGQELRRQLGAQGIVVRCPSNAELAEEAPLAYKDVDRVVDVVHRAGVARKVVRLKPLGVVKG